MHVFERVYDLPNPWKKATDSGCSNNKPEQIFKQAVERMYSSPEAQIVINVCHLRRMPDARMISYEPGCL